MVTIFIHFLYCFFATIFFCYLMNAPKRSYFAAGIISAIGYAIFELTILYNMPIFLGYFLATLFISIIGELLAMFLNMPSLILIFPAVIPLVPGIGLYHSLISFIKKDLSSFTKNGYETIFIAIIISATIAVIRSATRVITANTHKKLMC